MYSAPDCLPGYAKKLVKDWAIRSFFDYARQTIRTTLHAVQLRNPG